jgi:hypothetical protein
MQSLTMFFGGGVVVQNLTIGVDGHALPPCAGSADLVKYRRKVEPLQSL